MQSRLIVEKTSSRLSIVGLNILYHQSYIPNNEYESQYDERKVSYSPN